MNGKKVNRKVVTLVWLVVGIVLWEIGAYLLQDVFMDTMAKQKLPYLHIVAVTFVQNIGPLFDSAMVTLSKAGLGFLIGGIVGVIVALFMSYSRIIEKITLPYVIVSQMIPILGLAPIVYSIVRSGDMARIVIAAYITFFPVTINMLAGLKSVDKDKIDLLYSNAASKMTMYRKLMIPASLPSLFAGLKLAAPRSITAAILVEMLGTDKGIGVKILYTLYYGPNGTYMFWSSVITAALLGIFAYMIIVFIEKISIPWETVATGNKEGIQ